MSCGACPGIFAKLLFSLFAYGFNKILCLLYKGLHSDSFENNKVYIVAFLPVFKKMIIQ